MVSLRLQVVALNSRVAQLSKQLRDSQAREKALTAELEGAKRGGRGQENGEAVSVNCSCGSLD